MSDALPLPMVVAADNSVRYQVTEHDVLTLARSIRKESRADAVELFWCYVQRLVMRHRAGNRVSLASLITSHSQPINPRWFPDGDFCRPGGQYHGKQPCAAAPSRPANASIPWDRIEADVRANVVRCMRAEVSNPVERATDFAAVDLVDRKVAAGTYGFAMVRRGVQGRTNSFVSEAASRAWPAGYVRVVYGGTTSGAGGMGLGKVAAVVAVLVVLATFITRSA